MSEEQTALVKAPGKGQKFNKTSRVLAIREGEHYQADYVPHLQVEQVKTLVAAIPKERDRLLIQTLFDGCLRVSEAIGLRPMDILSTSAGFQLNIVGKGGKRSTVAISPSLAARLYGYSKSIDNAESIFRISRSRVFQIVKSAMVDAGITPPSRERDKVGAVHILRHSGALSRLKETGNPKSVQDQLRHRSAAMTLRYMKTLSHEESIAIQQAVDFGW